MTGMNETPVVTASAARYLVRAPLEVGDHGEQIAADLLKISCWKVSGSFRLGGHGSRLRSRGACRGRPQNHPGVPGGLPETEFLNA